MFRQLFGQSVGSSPSIRPTDDVKSKSVPGNVQVVIEQGGARIVDDHEENDLSRALSQRHIQMIALAGAIVGLHLASTRTGADTSRERDSSSVSAALCKKADPSEL
jgi:amino acid permease